MSASHRHGGDAIAGAHVHGGGGLGVLGADVPVIGTDGASYLGNDVELPGEADDEFVGPIVTWPTDGVLVVQESSAFVFDDAPDGAYFFTYQPKKNGANEGAPQRVDLLVGVAPLAGAGLVLLHGLAAAPAGQAHRPAGAQLVQGAQLATGALPSGSVQLGAAPLAQGAQIAVGTAVQTHALPASGLVQPGQLAAAAAGQRHALLGAGTGQGLALGAAAARQPLPSGPLQPGIRRVVMQPIERTVNLMSRYGEEVPPKDIGEPCVITFDYEALPEGVTIVSAAIEFDVRNGSDPAALQLVDGEPQVEGRLVMQALHAGGRAEVTYGLRCVEVLLSNDTYAPVLAATMRVVRI